MAVMASIAAELNQLANISDDDDDFILLRVESILDTLGHFAAVTNSDVDPRVINNLSEVVQCLQTSDFPGSLVGPGRPRYDIPLETLRMHLLNGFTAQELANLFGASERTIRRRMKPHHLRVSDLYSTISDAELDSTIEEIQRMYPNSGYRIIHGHLQARGLHVQTCLFCRWRLVIHGGIDGFSRLIVYLSVSPNNSASTVLSNFISAVNQYGIPSRV
ncbi:uncharacterized protein LOC113093121 [Carassius auratus]|uniref:Uncharacterized protein LOC113093121 n=1 Tax=Carassius auratus TaxID=7957 RepID=A0A6P6P132_CARAU|nr:uncharacterized protein LOC113093121 [Carassius auratus]